MPDRDREENDLEIAVDPDDVTRVSASLSDNRFILNVGEDITEADRTRVEDAGLEIIRTLDTIGYLVVEGEESDVASLPYDYAPDVNLSLESPD